MCVQVEKLNQAVHLRSVGFSVYALDLNQRLKINRQTK